jgi:hypothetical protein
MAYQNNWGNQNHQHLDGVLTDDIMRMSQEWINRSQSSWPPVYQTAFSQPVDEIAVLTQPVFQYFHCPDEQSDKDMKKYFEKMGSDEADLGAYKYSDDSEPGADGIIEDEYEPGSR